MPAASSRRPVRCLDCFWTGSRKTDEPDGTPLEKGCPNGHDRVVVGGPPPTLVQTTPSGIEIAFWDSLNVESGQKQQRRYTVNGERFRSVTTYLGVLSKDALLDWVATETREGRDWRQTRDEAGERGDHLHRLLLAAVLKQKVSLADLPDEYRVWGQAAMRWLRYRNPKVDEAEQMVASLEHRYSGRFDLLCSILGTRGLLVDFKTVSKWSHDGDELRPPFPENLLQLDLYAGAMAESGYPAPERGVVVRLGPDASFDETFVDLDPERPLGVLAAHRSREAATAALREARKTPDREAVAA